MTFPEARHSPGVKMKRSRFAFVLCIAAATLFASPAWGAAFCVFRGSGLSLNFGTLDPSSNLAVTMPVVASATFANMAGDCNPINQTMTISIQGGATSRQLTNGTDTIAYNLSGAVTFPVTLARPGNNNWATWFTAGQITGTIQWTAYADAPAGTYQDTVTIVVNP